jgi:cation diffusion facilitator CzcD-associated flavoprotein CzcO
MNYNPHLPEVRADLYAHYAYLREHAPVYWVESLQAWAVSRYDVSPEERQAFYEQIWAEPGFKKWFGNFQDLMTDRKANETYAEFVRNKIRERVKDPVVAEKLVPKDHPFGSKRIPLESGYYEVYNQDNVLLVDIRKTPIERITPTGIKTSNAEYELDVIIYATGFDAVTGELTRMDIRGEGGQNLKEKWADGPRTYLGLQTAGFPNFFIANAAVFCNIPRCAEIVVEWVSNCIGYMRKKDLKRIAATPQAEDAWTEHDLSPTAGQLFTESNSWFMGANIPGKKRTFLLYAGGSPLYWAKVEEVAANGYEGFLLQ